MFNDEEQDREGEHTTDDAKARREFDTCGKMGYMYMPASKASRRTGRRTNGTGRWGEASVWFTMTSVLEDSIAVDLHTRER